MSELDDIVARGPEAMAHYDEACAAFAAAERLRTSIEAAKARRCPATVVRSTGQAPTPGVAANEPQRCNGPIAAVAHDGTTVVDKACRRHRQRVWDLAGIDGLSVLEWS